MAYPVLDWRSRHDPKSKQYPIRSVIGTKVPRVLTLWPIGPVLDQGQEGACVGHGWTNEATAEPYPVNFAGIDLGPDDLGNMWPHDPQAFAFAFYEWCQRHDPWAGEDYSGTSVLTGAQGMQALGFIPEFRWAFGIEDVCDTICGFGPVVLGIVWKSGMYDAPGGELRATGDVVGGHCILAVGYDPAHRFSDGTVTEAVALCNSWGASWGIGGVAWIRKDELATLLEDNGEACVPVQRAYGPIGDDAAVVNGRVYRGRGPSWRDRIKKWLLAGVRPKP